MASAQSKEAREAKLRALTPSSLARARALVHRAVQLLTMAARANLAAVADDSHSNLGWIGENGQFRSQLISNHNAEYFIGLSVAPLRLSVTKNQAETSTLDLDGVSYVDASTWLDQRLGEAGLEAASKIKLPYELPADVADINLFAVDGQSDALAALAAWFDLADELLSSFAAEKSALMPGPSPVRCWPHHFDIATYVGLESGDFETARGIGVGMSPGDETYGQPYFYINPWPHLDAKNLPQLFAPGHWHTEGFVGAIATGEEVLSLDDIGPDMSVFINGAFAIGREKLGV